jgi:hypothetical protein
MHVIDWGEELLFPADLKRVLEGRAQGGVSCSVICPGDVFAGETAASIGCIGVILRMNSKESLVSATTGDHGTSVDKNNNRIADEQIDLSVDDLAATLKLRTTHSEWAVRDFTPIGIFMGYPYEVWHRYDQIAASCDVPEEFDDFDTLQTSDCSERRVDLDELQRTFPGTDIYTFADGGIVRWSGSEWATVSHQNLYPIHE